MVAPRPLFLYLVLALPCGGAAAADWAIDAGALTQSANALRGRMELRYQQPQAPPVLPPPDPRRVNQGFEALGPAGSTGKVDGPFLRGNGRYEVLRNDATELQLHLKTGYVDGTLRLLIDAADKVWLGFWGKVFDPRNGKTYDLKNWAQIRMDYDARKDEGAFRWVENGKPKSEHFSGGASGNDMTIELAGGWDHQFKRER
ncbi:MAG: hypothetical protein HY925_14190 [Elusimicrobia bacterium]|nr:hypothetical protein [Elusimicrobiota bacterium]